MSRQHLVQANLDRQHTAAAAEAYALNKSLIILGGDIEPASAQTAVLRMQHPQASYSELAALHEPPLTKDAVRSRLRTIICRAARQRIKQTGQARAAVTAVTIGAPR